MKITRKPGPGADRLKKLLKSLDDAEGKVGWFESAKYEDGTPVAYVASIQEYGDTKHKIPPRPFMRRAIVENEKQWRQIIRAEVKQLIDDNRTVEQVMEGLVLRASGDVRKVISILRDPPLKKSTVDARTRRTAQYAKLKTLKARKKRLVANRENATFTKPLVDTKILISTLTGIVEKKS